METSSHKQIEYFDGSVPLINGEYHQEPVDKYNNCQRIQLFLLLFLYHNQSNIYVTKLENFNPWVNVESTKKAEANGYVEKIKHKKRTVTDNDREKIVRLQELGDKVDYKAIDRILDKNPSTTRKLLGKS